MASDYDSGHGSAGKSFAESGRRLLWSWIHGPVASGSQPDGILMDGMLSVPRTVRWDARTRQLLIAPAEEVALLRSKRLASLRGLRLTPSEKDTKLAQKLCQLLPVIAVLPRECMSQLASFGPN